ncbi:MAG: vWA domain-containing protein [Myxococcota bacterium]
MGSQGRRIALALAFTACAALTACTARTGLDAPSLDTPGEAPDECLELTADNPLVVLSLPYTLRIATADILFLVDVTGSMGGEVAAIREGLRTRLAPALFATIPGTRIGVASFADFPVRPHGSPSDAPFVLLQRPTEDLDVVEAAVAELAASGGNDEAESQVEALFQLASGTGAGAFIAPVVCPPGTVGGGCFRPDATPVVLVITDAGSHNGPDGVAPYTAPEVRGLASSYEDARDALRRRGARVLGLFSGTDSGFRGQLERVARDSGAVGEDGAPLVVDIGRAGERLDEAAAEVVGRLVEESPVDVDLLLEDVGGDDGDALALVRAVELDPPRPPSGAQVTEGGYANVLPGTRIGFTLRFDLGAVAPRPQAQRFRLVATLRGDGAVALQRRTIDLVVRGGGEGCPAAAP